MKEKNLHCSILCFQHQGLHRYILANSFLPLLFDRLLFEDMRNLPEEDIEVFWMNNENGSFNKVLNDEDVNTAVLRAITKYGTMVFTHI